MAVQQGYGKMAGANSLVFAYDTGDAVNSYKGEPTENLISQMIGTTKVNYPEVVYRCTELEANVADSSVPSGFYSRFTGIDSSDNNQLYSRFNTANIDVRNQTVSYSVYLKGSGTCHLSIYADNVGYGTTSTITLTSEWVRYSYTRPLTEYTSNAWVAVRGVLNTTDVYISSQQAELKNHSTPFVIDGRSATEGLLDLTGTTSIDLSNVSFDSDAYLDLDGSSDYVDLGADLQVSPINQGWTAEYIVKTDSASTLQHFNGCEEDVHNAGWIALYNSKLAVWNRDPGGWYYGDTVFTSNTWYHVTFVQVNGTTMQFYVNGVAEGGSHTTYSWNASKSAFFARYIGRYEYSGNYSRYWNGKIPVTKLYNRALSAAEVKSNFNNYKTRFNIA